MAIDWEAILRERLAGDPDFRERFAQRPGEAAASLGIPYEEFREIWPAFTEASGPE